MLPAITFGRGGHVHRRQPLFHIMALGLFMAIGLNKGNTTMLMPVPQVDAILETIQRYRVRWLLGVPALYRMILENDRLDRYDLSSLTYCYCGGDVLPAEVKGAGAALRHTPSTRSTAPPRWGMYLQQDRIEPSRGPSGFPWPSRECLIVNPETLEPVAPVKAASCWSPRPTRSRPTWNKPEETENLCVEVDGKDLVPDGRFRHSEPTGDLIYVERRPTSSSTRATGFRHPRWKRPPGPSHGHRRLRGRGSRPPVGRTHQGHRGAQGGRPGRRRNRADSVVPGAAGPYKVPAYIEFRDMLPKSKVGKLLRREVRDEERRRIAPQTEGSDEMDVLVAIENRRSCRDFLDEPVPEKDLRTILTAAAWAPSPLNAQPWQFLVVTESGLRAKICAEAERCRSWAIETSGWKWLEKYSVAFLKSVPVFVVVVGDPRKTGVDMFMEEGAAGYQHACAAAVQNMMLAAHAVGLGSLWFTLFDRGTLKKQLPIAPGKVPLAVVCIGKPAAAAAAVPRKSIEKSVTWLR
jgi:nitroreductase